MDLKRRWRQLLLLAGDLCLFYAALWLALTVRGREVVAWDSFTVNAIAFTGFLALRQGVFLAVGLYELRVIRNLESLIRNILAAAGIDWILGTTFFYLLSPYVGMTPKTNLLLTVLISHTAAFAWRRAWLAILSSSPLLQRVVFLGSREKVLPLLVELEKTPQLGFVPVRPGASGFDLVVADTHWLEDNWEEARPVFGDAVRRRVPVVSLERFYESVTGKIAPEDAGDPSWMVEHIFGRNRGLYQSLKRAGDAALSALLLVAFAPLILLIAAAIRLSDGGSPFYSQRRLGLMGREFRVWKFRTMVEDADHAGAFSGRLGEDPRVTRLGRFLRRFRLDELPQLWNVLKGDMSLVGPRPEWIQEVEVIERVLPHYHIRHLVRPGITGWAQVYFRATNNPGDSLEKLRYDLYYVKNMSAALDLSILLKTAKRVLLHDSTIPVRLQEAPPAFTRGPVNIGVLLGRE